MLFSTWWIAFYIKIVFTKEGKDKKTIMAKKWGGHDPLAPPVPTPMASLAKLVGQKVTLDDGFSASMVKISHMMSANLKVVYQSTYSLGSAWSFRILISSKSIKNWCGKSWSSCGRNRSWWGSCPTNWIGQSTRESGLFDPQNGRSVWICNNFELSLLQIWVLP